MSSRGLSSSRSLVFDPNGPRSEHEQKEMKKLQSGVRGLVVAARDAGVRA
jgi:hypothetical protein